jgi:hypothetical protein
MCSMRASEWLARALCVSSSFVTLRTVHAAAPEAKDVGAEPGEQSGVSEGESLFRRGRLALNAAEFEVARDFFERSFRVDPALGTLLNLAVCEEKLGRLLKAHARLQQALAVANPGDKRRVLITQRLVELEQRIPRLRLELEAPLAPGVELFLDEQPISIHALAADVPLDAGPHVVRCASARSVVCSASVQLGERETRSLRLRIHNETNGDARTSESPRSGRETSRAPDRAPAHQSPSRTLVWVLGGMGVAGLGMGLAGGLIVLDAKTDVSRHCDVEGCDSKGRDAAARGKLFSLVSTVSTGLGVGLLGGAAYVFLVPPSATRGGSLTIAGRFP